MKKITFFIAMLSLAFNLNAQTMTFDSGASETGFTFTNWNAAGGAIFSGNLANPTVITKDSGTFDFVSFDVTGFLSDTTFDVTSNLGDTYSYNTDTAQTHTLNWVAISSISRGLRVQ